MAKKEYWLVSTKAKGLKFRIVDLNRETQKATLLGDTGVPFEHSITEDTLKNLGYEIKVVEASDAAVHSEPASA